MAGMTTRRDFLQGMVAAAAVPGMPQARAQEPRPASTVGSLLPFIESQAVKGEFPLSFLNSRFQDLTEWKKQARARVLDLLHYAPPPCDPKGEVVEQTQKEDYLLQKVLFNTTPDIRVPAYVLIPAKVPLPRPAVVLLHDHGGFYMWGKEKLVPLDGEHPVLAKYRQDYYGGVGLATELVRQGYVVIVIDMFYWGERRMLLDDDPADWRSRPATMPQERINQFNRRSGDGEQLVARTIYSAGFTWAGVMFWDDMRTVDYLLTRPEVDKNRIACVGLSVGSIRSAHLAAFDDRIKAAVAVCWMTSFPPQLRRKIVNTIGFTKLIPGLYREMDYPDVTSMAMPTPVMYISGLKDGLFEVDAMRASFEKLAACYRKAGAPEKLSTRLYDTPHQFNQEMQKEAWAWLARWV
jgi:dienelactone hydrolase